MLEVLIAAFITSILAASAFQFFTRMSSQTEAQYQFSDAQLITRNSVAEVKKSMRMAGFKLDGHDPYDLAGDTVMIFMENANPVDTIKYYLVEFSSYDRSQMPNLPDSQLVYRLMKQTNSDLAAIYSDYITEFQVTAVTSNTADILISAITSMPNLDQTKDNGFRTYSLTERVFMRNVS